MRKDPNALDPNDPFYSNNPDYTWMGPESTNSPGWYATNSNSVHYGTESPGSLPTEGGSEISVPAVNWPTPPDLSRYTPSFWQMIHYLKPPQVPDVPTSAPLIPSSGAVAMNVYDTLRPVSRTKRQMPTTGFNTTILTGGRGSSGAVSTKQLTGGI